MPDYKSMYYHLSGRMAGAIEALEAITETIRQAQQTTEDMFINSKDEDLEDKPEEAE
ncbi:MAG: hypothetical protein ACOYI4_06700 [Christensenellales bacterium]|jgi:hypothetical protein